MTFIMPLMSRSSEIIGFIVRDRTGKTELKRFDDLYHIPESTAVRTAELDHN